MSTWKNTQKTRDSVKKEMAYLLEEVGCRSTNISATQLENLPCYRLQITSTSVDLQRLCFEGNGESPDVVTAPITPIETTNRKTPPEALRLQGRTMRGKSVAGGMIATPLHLL